MQVSFSGRINTLLEAVLVGNLGHLFEMVCPGNVNYTDPRYRLTLLQWAVSLGRLPTVELLLSRGATLFTTDLLGFTPLHRAVWCADASVVQALLFLSPASRFPTRDITGGVVATAASKQKQQLPPTPQRGDGRPLSISDTTSDTRTSDATSWYSSSASRDRSSVSEDEEGNEHRTTATRSSSSQNRSIPQPQLTSADSASSANNNNSTNNNFTAWLAAGAATTGNARGNNAGGDVSVTWRPGAQRLVNMPHPQTGRTPLMLAAVRGNTATVMLLIHVCGADMYAKDNDGFSAADLAALCGHADVLKLFLAKAAGDGTGRAFQNIQQHAEEYCNTANTIPQRARLNDMNRMMCLDLAMQSYVSSK